MLCRKLAVCALGAFLATSLVGCVSEGVSEKASTGNAAPSQQVVRANSNLGSEEGAQEYEIGLDEEAAGGIVDVQINGRSFQIELADNSSAAAFADLFAEGPLTVQMEDYGGFEKVGPIDATLPQNNEQITTEPGDVILYQGDKVAIYYAPNSWNFTRLGKVQGVSADELKSILGDGGATAVFSLA